MRFTAYPGVGVLALFLGVPAFASAEQRVSCLYDWSAATFTWQISNSAEYRAVVNGCRSGNASSVSWDAYIANVRAVVRSGEYLGAVQAQFQRFLRQLEQERDHLREAPVAPASKPEFDIAVALGQLKASKRDVLDRWKGLECDPSSLRVGKDWCLSVTTLTPSAIQQRYLGTNGAPSSSTSAAPAADAKPTPKSLSYKEVSSAALNNAASTLRYKDIVIEDSGHPILSPGVDARIRRTVNTLFVGGTGVVEGFYVPPGAAPSVRATEERNLRTQLASKGLSPEAIAAYLRGYRGFDMMIGLGADPGEPGDLLKRVVGFGTNNDQFSNGSFTAEHQPLYASLQGTKTTRLDCHSNGAMVCLAALSQGDVQTQDVRLFGPQLSADALRRWQQLISNKTLRSVEINMMYDDPIAPMSYRADKMRTDMIAGGLLLGPAGAVAATAWNSVAALVPPVEDVRAGIRENAPSIRVNILNDPGCSERRWADLRGQFFACHDMALYLQKAPK